MQSEQFSKGYWVVTLCNKVAFFWYCHGPMPSLVANLWRSKTTLYSALPLVNLGNTNRSTDRKFLFSRTKKNLGVSSFINSTSVSSGVSCP